MADDINNRNNRRRRVERGQAAKRTASGALNRSASRSANQRGQRSSVSPSAGSKTLRSEHSISEHSISEHSISERSISGRSVSKRSISKRTASKRSAKPLRERAFKRNRGGSRSASFTAGIFILAAIVYIAQSAYFFFTKPHIATELVEMGSVALPETMSGIIIRDEVVYSAVRDGQVNFAVGEYDRVKAGTVICSIQNTQAVEEINRERASIEEQIMAYQAMREDISDIDPAVRRLNDQISNTVETNLYAFTSQNVSEVYALKEDIVQMVDTRDKMIVNENYNVKSELGVQHQQLLNRLEQNTAEMITVQSGLVTQVVDGLESAYTLENMKDLTREQAAVTVDYNDILVKKEAVTGEPVFKIVASNSWYIGVYIPNELVEGFAVDDRRIMHLEDPAREGEYIPVTLVVEYISQNYSDSYVLFRCNKNIIEYLNTRNVNIRTSDSVRTGFKISNSAVTYRSYLSLPLEYITRSEEYGAYVLTNVDGEGLVRVPVIIMDEDENFAYVPEATPGLAPGVQIKLDELPLYTVAAAVEVPGVYRVSGGLTEFIRITLSEGESDEGGYTLLDPALNHGLKSYDYIVMNAANITEGQVVN